MARCVSQEKNVELAADADSDAWAETSAMTTLAAELTLIERDRSAVNNH